MKKITPFLWFDTQAEEAANFYVSVFKNSKILTTTHYSEASAKASGMKEGMAMVVDFELDGNRFQAINGGPHFKFSPAVSFTISCDGQEEVDYYWDKLSEGGNPKAQQCGWLADKFGLSWQVIPGSLGEFMTKGTPEQRNRVMAEVMQMKKFDIAKMRAAFDAG